MFDEAGLRLEKSNNDREAGWLAIKELLKIRNDGQPRLKIFRNCTKLISDLPALQYDDKRPTDTAHEPHEITHAPDSLRYFAIYWTYPAVKKILLEEHKLPWELDGEKQNHGFDFMKF